MKTVHHLHPPAGGALAATGAQFRNSLICVKFSGPFLAASLLHYHCGRKRYVINSEAFSTCNSYVKFTFVNSQELHACISYMGSYMPTCWGNDTQVLAIKTNFR